MYRRRWITSIYTKSHIQSSSYVPLILQKVLYDRFIPQLQQSSISDVPLDVLPLNISYGLDFLSAFIFGLHYGTNFIEDVPSRDEWFHHYMQSHSEKKLYWVQEHPTLTKTLARLGFRLIPGWTDAAQQWMEDWALDIVDRIEADKDADVPDVELPSTATTAYTQFKTSITNDHRTSKDSNVTLGRMEMRLQLASECLDHLCTHEKTLLAP